MPIDDDDVFFQRIQQRIPKNEALLRPCLGSIKTQCLNHALSVHDWSSWPRQNINRKNYCYQELKHDASIPALSRVTFTVPVLTHSLIVISKRRTRPIFLMIRINAKA